MGEHEVCTNMHNMDVQDVDQQFCFKYGRENLITLAGAEFVAQRSENSIAKSRCEEVVRLIREERDKHLAEIEVPDKNSRKRNKQMQKINDVTLEDSDEVIAQPTTIKRQKRNQKVGGMEQIDEVHEDAEAELHVVKKHKPQTSMGEQYAGGVETQLHQSPMLQLNEGVMARCTSKECHKLIDTAVLVHSAWANQMNVTTAEKQYELDKKMRQDKLANSMTHHGQIAEQVKRYLSASGPDLIAIEGILVDLHMELGHLKGRPSATRYVRALLKKQMASLPTAVPGNPISVCDSSHEWVLTPLKERV